MSAVLRASGQDFDVDAFLLRSSLNPIAVHRRGTQIYLGSGQRAQSGMNIDVSDRGFEDFPGQVLEAVNFLTKHRKEISRLIRFPGVEKVYVDFGIARQDVAAQFAYLPTELIRIAGKLGLGIELSYYAIKKSRKKRK